MALTWPAAVGKRCIIVLSQNVWAYTMFLQNYELASIHINHHEQ